MLQTGRMACIGLLAFWACALIGCGGQERNGPGAPTAPPPAAKPTPAAISATLEENYLSDHGFVLLWSKQPTEGAFQGAYFLPEGIFAVARPQLGGPGWRLIRYNQEDGLPLWFYDLQQPLAFPPVAYRYPPSPEGPRLDEVYNLQKDTVVCLTLRDGAELWKTDLPFSASCAPVVDEKQYYMGSYDRRIYAVGKNKRFPLWQHVTGGEIRASGVIAATGQIYFASTDKSVYRLEPTGWLQGKSWNLATGGPIFGSPVLFSRWVLVGSTDFKLYSLEVDGTRNWEFPAESAIQTTPMAMSLRPDKGLVFCVSRIERSGEEKNVLWVLDAKNGEKLWQRDNIERAITIGKHAAYLLTDARAGSRSIVVVDPLKGTEITSLPVDAFDFIPTNDAEHGANAKARGTVYLISKTGFMAAIQEKP